MARNESVSRPVEDIIIKPQFVLDVEMTTGLNCELAKDVGWRTDWWVLSPTGLPMFKIGGDVDMIGSISQPDMYLIQGVDAAERSRRRRDW